MSLFVFGYGFSARAAIAAMRAGTAPPPDIWATTRAPDKARALAQEGIGGLVFTGETPGAGVAAALAGARSLIASIAPDAEGDPVLVHHGADIAAPALDWICYYSTVGVYGDFDGAWIDERAPLSPRNPRSVWRAEAEGAWQDLADRRGIALLILRLAGIYGPGRSPVDKLRAGTARRIVKPGQVFNRIHVDDIGRVTALAAARKLSGIFNLADDLPAPPQEVVTHGAGLLGIAAPPEEPFETAQMSPMARSFYADTKRVSNAAIKRALGIDLLYPTYREGLAAILRAETEAVRR